MVRKGGNDKPDQQVFAVKPLKETAWYVERMPGGVREGGREASPYSIGATVRSRTADLRITSALLYLLSYSGVWSESHPVRPRPPTALAAACTIG